METGSVKNRMARDTLLYIPAKALEGIIGIVTLSLYSSFFAPAMYGDYNLAIITVNIAFLLLLGWLLQSVFRFINGFSSTNRLKLFYSTVFRIWLLANGIAVILATILLVIIKLCTINQSYEFVLITVIMFFTYSTVSILFSLITALRMVRLNLTLSLFSVSAKLVLTTLGVKLLHMDIKASIFAIILVDLLVISVIIARTKIHRYIVLRAFSPTIFNKFKKFGIPLVGVGIFMSLLNVSDRYIIKAMLGSSQLGIYTANYAIASAVFTMIMVAIMRGVYPSVLKAWKSNKKSDTEDLLSHAVRYFLLISVPAATGLSVLSYRVSKILDPKYLPGSNVIIWVSIGMLFLGLTEYSNKAWELTSKTGQIFKNTLISCLLNVVLNLLLVPIYGYPAAAFNTMLSYLAYFIISHQQSRKILKWHIPFRKLLNIVGSSLLMAAVLYLTSMYIPNSTVFLVLLVFIGFIVYAASLYLAGEIRNEVRQIFLLLHREKPPRSGS